MQDCSTQLRFVGSMAGAYPVGLDYTSVMLVAAARGADLPLLTEVLPDVEAALLSSFAGGGSDEGM